MMIGLGIDIIDNRRIKKTMDRFGNKFIEKCFSINEIYKSDQRKNIVNYFAKRYAAKEACAKALGIGLAKKINWKDIEIMNDINGKPYINLYNNALNRLKQMSKKKCNIFLSLSDEKNYSIANVSIFEL
jgi:holo-[acyl-carrier protein] synthase